MILADFGVAVVIILGLVIFGSLIARERYRQLHPPPTIEEVTSQLEDELNQINKEIGE